MVGPPKTLYDLRKVDADLRIICRACGRRAMVDREWLIAELLRRRRSVDWEMVSNQMRCSAEGCGQRNVRLAVVPFAGRDTPPAVQAVLDALNAYLGATRGKEYRTVGELEAIGATSGALHRAIRRLIMWAKYGLEPEEPG